MSKNIALVLSGGGARGIAHIGVIEVLLERNYNITSLAGTSMGALVGGFYAMNKLDVYKKFLLELDKRKIFLLLDFGLGSKGIVKGDKLIATLKELCPDTNIEDLPLPYTAVATDLLNKKEVVYTKGSIYDAIRASISIPSFFTPVKKEQQLLVDGGVLNNIPIKHVFRTNKDLIFAVDVNANVPLIKPDISKNESAKIENDLKRKLNIFNREVQKLKPKTFTDQMGFMEVMENTIALMTQQISHLHLEKNPPDLLIEISHDICSTFDFFKAKDIIEMGRLYAKESLERYEKN